MMDLLVWLIPAVIVAACAWGIIREVKRSSDD